MQLLPVRLLVCLLAFLFLTTAAEAGDLQRIMKIVEYQKAKDYKNALTLMWDELEDPAIPDDKEYLSNLRIITISLLLPELKNKRPDPEIMAAARQYYDEGVQYLTEAQKPLKDIKQLMSNFYSLAVAGIGDYADEHGVKPEYDEEALEYYHKAIELAGDDRELRANADKIMVNYYSDTGRNGLALPYLKQNMEHWKKAGDTYMVINILDAFASAYGDMGQLELESYYRQRCLDMAKTYFILGKQPENPKEWLQYKTFLFKEIDSSASLGKTEEVLELWALAEPIIKKYITPESISYSTMAECMAMCGEKRKAEKFLKQCRQLMKKEKHPHLQQDYICTKSAIDMYLGNYKSAAKNAEACIAAWDERQADAGITTYRNAGLIFEKLREYDKAIGYFRKSIERTETTRDSYSVAQRATFFRSTARKAYWGLTRCLARKYANGNSEADFLAALQASELVRGRQFGELIDEDDRLTPQMLAEFRKSIGP